MHFNCLRWLICKRDTRLCPRLHQAIEEALERYVEDFDIEAVSIHYFQQEAGEAVLKKWMIDPAGIDVLSDDGPTLTLAIQVDAQFEFYAQFSFERWDGVDREYIRLPGAEGSVLEDLDVQVVVVLQKEDLKDPVPVSIEVEGSGVTVEFGEIEPTWG